jgi:hypothetical protein
LQLQLSRNAPQHARCVSYHRPISVISIQAALESVVYAPTGFFLQHQAWRKNVSGTVQVPLPFFWGVNKAV